MINAPFLEWFNPHILIGGDWRFFHSQNLKEITSYTYAWDQSLNTGVGQSNLIIIWLNSYLAFATYITNHLLSIPWDIAEKLIFFWPILLCSFFSAFFLSKNYFRAWPYNSFAGLIYLTNTYALMIFAGGQVGIGLAYSLLPFLLLLSIQFLEQIQNTVPPHLLLRKFLLITLAFALEMLFEPRILLLALFSVALYMLYSFITGRFRQKKIVFFSALGCGFLVCLLHSFWILPLLFSPGSVSVGSLGMTANVKFLSFANFSDSIGLLHPNWPENIFGKVQFMRPEFLILPILSYGSIFFVNRKTPRSFFILFFSFLGLIGAFMAKGTNPPFGNIYTALSSVPGFVAYRDSTKWYMLIALSYSILLPTFFYEIQKLSFSLSKRISQWMIIPVLLLWVFFIRQAFVPGLTGTFTYHVVPSAYDELTVFLENQSDYFRTLWVPQVQRFGYFSNNHPAVAASQLLKTSSLTAINAKLKDPSVESLLRERSIKYVILPEDAESEIFLEDRKYSQKLHTAARTTLEEIPWLTHAKDIGNIHIFEVMGYKDHIWTLGNSTISWTRINPSTYTVKVNNNRGGKIIFTESYSPGWKAVVNEREFSSQEYKGMNSFDIHNMPNSFHIEFVPQRWVSRGHIVSSVVLFVLSLGIVFTYLYRYHEKIA